MSFSGYLFGGDATKGLNPEGANHSYENAFLNNQLDSIWQRNAPQAQAAQLASASQLDPSQQMQARGQMQTLADRLNGIGAGTQVGAGEMAVNRQVGQAQANQQAMARMARGTNAALAARAAARGTADIGVNGAGMAAQAQMQDQQGANGQLGGVLNEMRGGDINVAGQNANLQQQRNMLQGQFGQQVNLANQGAQLQQTGMNDQANMGYLAQMMGMDQQQFQNEMAKRGLASQDKGIFPGLLQAGGTIAASYAGRPAGK